jgi:hypothetical protein
MHEIIGRVLLVYVILSWPVMVWITVKKWL